MTHWNHLTPSRIRRSIGFASGLLLMAGGLPALGGTFGFNGTSTLVGTHVGDPTAAAYSSAMTPIPVTTAALVAPFSGTGHSMSSAAPAWSSLARGGAAHVEAVNSARITFPAGMGVDQTDATHAIGASSYEMDFDFSWTVGGSAIVPIGSTFSIPIGATVAAGGSASFVAHIHWDIISGATTYTDARAKYFTPVTAFPVGVTATSFTAPAAAFTPGTLALGDKLRIYGYLLFTADNASAPARVEVLSDFANVDLTYQTSDPFYSLVQSLQNNPEFQRQPHAGVDNLIQNVPEPSGLMALAIASMGMLGRRRKINGQ